MNQIRALFDDSIRSLRSEGFLGWLRRTCRFLACKSSHLLPANAYWRFCRLSVLSQRELAICTSEWKSRAALEALPLISIVIPVFRPELKWLKSLADSLVAQVYPSWEAIFVDDGSNDSTLDAFLSRLETDERIRVVRRESNGGISAASNDGLAVVRGGFVTFVAQGDMLVPEALDHVARVVLRYSDCDLVYSDEDKIDQWGHRFDYFAKPDYSPWLLLELMYTCHLAVYRTALVRGIGGFRGGFDGAQDHDLALRFVELTHRIRHIPRVLYHRRDNSLSLSHSAPRSAWTREAGRRVVEDALTRRGIGADVAAAPIGYHVALTRGESPLVSIIVPIRDKPEVLERLVTSMKHYATYRNHELIIVDNGSVEQRTRELLLRLESGDPRVRVFHDEGEFNFPRLNNMAARRAAGDVLLMLNNDTEVIHDNWLEPMLEHALRARVGAVGALLLYPNDSLQHAGVTFRWPAGPRHKFSGWPADRAWNLSHAIAIHLDTEVCAVTAACLMVRKHVYLEVGGMDESRFAVEFNDVDLCLRLRAMNYEIMISPRATLIHHESKTRGRHSIPSEKAALEALWHARGTHDPYWNPNLSYYAGSMVFAKPWKMPASGILPGDQEHPSYIRSALYADLPPAG